MSDELLALVTGMTTFVVVGTYDPVRVSLTQRVDRCYSGQAVKTNKFPKR